MEKGAYFFDYAVNHFGIAFSETKLIQTFDEKIDFVPQIDITEVIWEVEWRKFSFEFIADKPYEYLIMGSFYEGSDITSEKVSSGTFIQEFSYIFILIDGERLFIDEF